MNKLSPILSIFLAITWLFPQSFGYAATSSSQQLQVDISTTQFEQDTSTFDQQIPIKSKKKKEQNSVDFLMGSSPLAKYESGELPDFQIKPVDKKSFEKKLGPQVSEENCVDRQADNRKYTQCVERYSDGAYIETITHEIKLDTEFKKQVVITKFDPKGERLHRKSIRHKKTMSMLGELEVEHFDIVTRPGNGKISREFMIRQFDTGSSQPEKLIWTKYRQIGKEMFAEISHHAVLNYDQTGQPLKGRAEKWNQGEVSDTLLYWDKIKSPALRLDKTSWNQWESQINNLMHQATTF